MSQMVVSARDKNLGIALNCPHCKYTCRHDISHVEDCIQLHEALVCVACGGEFYIELTSPDSRGLTLREADAPKQTSPSRIFSGDYSRDMWQLINDSKRVSELQDALYLVCCRLQELESKLAKSGLV